jgi:hypothetical protein
VKISRFLDNALNDYDDKFNDEDGNVSEDTYDDSDFNDFVNYFDDIVSRKSEGREILTT